jgi:cytosine/adenosine deaminase-related metal-dependent hydrolase
LAGTTPDTALEGAVFAAGAADVDGVVCSGRELVREGRHVELDVAAELRTSIAEAFA